MKRNSGILILLISIGLTIIGSILKVMNQRGISEVVLWTGMITFIVAIGMVLYRIARPLSADRKNI